MTTHIVAGIDPGGTTGLVILQVEIDVAQKSIQIDPLYQDALEDTRDVVFSIRYGKQQPEDIYMEQRASNPTGPEGVEAYEAIRAGLTSIGYEIISRQATKVHCSRKLYLIGPGLWKPFIKAQAYKLPSRWGMRSPHVKDAMGLVLYGLHTRHKPRKVVFNG